MWCALYYSFSFVKDFVNTTSLLEIILFADDTTLLFKHPDVASKVDTISNELQEICNCFKANKLSVNTSKTNYMVLGTQIIHQNLVN